MHVNFCDDPDCLRQSPGDDSVITVGSAVHRSTHDLLKIRTVTSRTLWPTLYGKATAGLERFRSLGTLPDPPSAEECGQKDDVQAESSGSHEPIENQPPPAKCMVCQQRVYMGRCWYCLDCEGMLRFLNYQSWNTYLRINSGLHLR